MNRFVLAGVSLLALSAPFQSLAVGDEKPSLKSILEQSIIGPELSLKEVEDYAESRVPPMPEVKSAAEWETHARRMRAETLEKVVFRGEAAKWRDAALGVEWLETIEGGPGYRIRKLRYEALPGLWIPALLYEPEKLDGKVPVVLNVNGHDGQGKAADYKQILCINQAKRGMLALNVEWLGMGQLRGDGYVHYRMNQLDLCGTSGVAPFYLSMSRGLDVLLAHEYADPNRVAVAGLSGGGWQTIFISALDTRVTLSNPVAGYSSFRTRVRHHSDLGDSEQTPVDLATTADYAMLTAMRAPRPTLLTYNAADQCCFRADHALPPLLEAAGPIFTLYGKDQNLRSHVNSDPGSHNFGLDNRQQLYRMIGDHFFAGGKDATGATYRNDEIACADEVKTAEQLAVELPEQNANFNSLALALAKNLPRNAALPTAKEAIEPWQKSRRKQLAAILRSRDYDVQAVAEGEKEFDGGTATFWRLRLGGAWTVPAVELKQGDPKSTVLLVTDEGRAKAGEQVMQHLAAGRRVIAIDPFYFGESKIAKQDFLFGLLISAVGDRPLGIQADQLAAIARWSAKAHGTAPRIVAIGPRSSLFTVAAAALEPEDISGVELGRSSGSLKEILEQNLPVNAGPELFCAGLLEQFDIVTLAALVAPRPVTFPKPGKRARAELKPLKAWYALHGKELDPFE